MPSTRSSSTSSAAEIHPPPYRTATSPAPGASPASGATGPPPWACYAAGERTPRLTSEEPDLAYLGAAALAVTERRPRFRFEEDDQGREHLLQDGDPIGRTRKEARPALANTTLPTDLTRLHDLRLQPTALAHLLLSAPDEVLQRTGTLLLDELRRTRRAEGGER